MMFDVLVIGGGPAGVTAALRARELGATLHGYRRAGGAAGGAQVGRHASGGQRASKRQGNCR